MSTTSTKKHLVFLILTCIRQTGIKRIWDGTTTYTYVAMVHKDLPPVALTLTVSPDFVLHVHAHFDATQQVSQPEEYQEGGAA